MAEKKWKYVKEKPKRTFEEYLQLERDREYLITVKNPVIEKKLVEGNYRTVFTGTVIKIDEEETEKIIVIKNYDNAMYLKPKIAKKKEVTLRLTRKYNQDTMETYYDVVIVKENS